MNARPYPLRALGVSAMIFTAFTTSSQAALLVYEGFNYSAGLALNTITPNASTAGLDKTVAYAGNGAVNYVTGSGLTFGALTTSGGSISSAASVTAVGAAKLSLNTYVGTLWSSYLVSFSSISNTAVGNGALTRVANDISNNGERFNSYADSRIPSGSPSTNIGIAYNAASNITVGTTALSLDTTYILISKYTNVGSAVNAGTGTGTLYALSLSQFNSFLSAGGAESWLNSASIGTGASNVTGRVSSTNNANSTYLFQSGGYAQFVNVNDGVTFDELRYGSTLADVTPVPEPGTLGLAALGVGTAFLLRRKNGFPTRAAV
ncbi:MAG: hypothetical protein BGO12_02680 [Verrucomicrobia bacterium 61-8]|nr:MAG: hypothetical protein BGO12_02680 [Verrucomicrobia bacterium 61-8]